MYVLGILGALSGRAGYFLDIAVWLPTPTHPELGHRSSSRQSKQQEPFGSAMVDQSYSGPRRLRFSVPWRSQGTVIPNLGW